MTQAIPLLDLKAQFTGIRDEVIPALLDAIEQQRFILGQPVAAFEEAVAEYCGSRYAVSCASGTDALLLSLQTLDLRPGDEVITTPFTFFAMKVVVQLLCPPNRSSQPLETFLTSLIPHVGPKLGSDPAQSH